MDEREPSTEERILRRLDRIERNVELALALLFIAATARGLTSRAGAQPPSQPTKPPKKLRPAITLQERDAPA